MMWSDTYIRIFRWWMRALLCSVFWCRRTSLYVCDRMYRDESTQLSDVRGIDSSIELYETSLAMNACHGGCAFSIMSASSPHSYDNQDGAGFPIVWMVRLSVA
ncbi:hypothetical protein C8Q74DRAFT_1038726 [Fomes fomentarius]|nr:hypothetical protein C8Q74DRAFT_1038726 [Fomes fomentarius]